MLSRHLARSVCPALQTAARRPLSVSAVRMAEGDTGATRSGGMASGDAFTKKEQANEAYYVQQREREKLLALKKKISEHQKHLKELDASIDELSSLQGSEKK